MPVETRHEPCSIEVFPVVHPHDQPFQSSKATMNHKLLVLIIGIPIFTNLSADFYQAENSASDQRDVTLEKLNCWGKLNLLLSAFIDLPKVPEAEFNQFCKNATEAHDSIPKAKLNAHFNLSNIDGRVDQSYNCMLPTYTIAYHSCQLTFDDAVHTRDCYISALARYSGGPEEAECRQNCCHDPTILDASKLTKCGPANKDVIGKTKFCKNPVFDQTLKENGCLEACLARFLIRYGQHYCRYEAFRIFVIHSIEVEKKFLTNDQCFMKCPDEDES